jgi:ergothioneine biosynthesis protein EgtB
VKAWRSRVDEAVASVIRVAEEATLRRIELGTHHEEQHQELLLTDAKHALYANPLRPAYSSVRQERLKHSQPLVFQDFPETIAQIGAAEAGFAFDNERPRHGVIVPAFRLASRLVSNGEFAAFVEDGGYDRPEWWLADGWAAAQANHWRAPLYWEREGADWWAFGMSGMQPLDVQAPASHISFYEASAYALWSRARLPTEFEWERAAGDAGGAPQQMFGEVWQWTASAYTPYPRFRPLEGALGEYNGKFMSGQMVLRGGSSFSPRDHVRLTYRNFFPPSTRWQMTGVRLAKDV